jgi:hypothetical protein
MASRNSRQITCFISGEGIDRDVINMNICRYLGNYAVVRPGSHSVGQPESINFKSVD